MMENGKNPVVLIAPALAAFLSLSLTISCASLYNDYDKKVMDTKDFDDKVKVTEIPATVEPTTPPTPAEPTTRPVVKKGKTAKSPATPPQTGKSAAKVVPTPVESTKHLPELEDSEGFIGRRPEVNPFRVGEKVTYSVSYFAVEAGTMSMEIKSMVEVNGKKAYAIHYSGKSSSVFDMFYAVDDSAITYLDVETLVPTSYSLHVKESKQVREVRSYFNLQEMKAYMLDKRQKKGKELEVKDYSWEIPAYSQNVFSVAFYMRTFTFKVGKELQVRVAHEGKNILMKAKVLREEKLKTPAGTFDTWVIQPQFEMEGAFKPSGNNFIWLTKDDRKRIVRIESKIKIGTIVVGVQTIQ
ncbi:MAG: DUF3108 domain-containing protein [Bdellovibrionales bacterium]|nr:DUF3108 domain-containing protein [Bdellovibrionales bacterium]